MKSSGNVGETNPPESPMIFRTYPKIRWRRMSAQASLRKAIQFSGFLHQRILMLRRLASQLSVRSTTQRRAGKVVSPGMGHSSTFGSSRLIKQPGFRPFLKAFMQGAAGQVEPLALDRFPLTTRPQHVPNAIEHIPVVDPWPSWSFLLQRFGQVFLQLAPQIAGQHMIVYFSCFCGILQDDLLPGIFGSNSDGDATFGGWTSLLRENYPGAQARVGTLGASTDAR